MNPIGEDIGAVIADYIRTIVGGDPYYMYGRREEICERLIQKDKDAALAKKKYPLFILFMDQTGQAKGDVMSYNLHIAIVCLSNQVRNAEQRSVQRIEPVLYPLYEGFMQALSDSGLFTWPASGPGGDMTIPDHQKTDRPNWGVPLDEKGNTRHYLNDPTDAIEIFNLKLNQITC